MKNEIKKSTGKTMQFCLHIIHSAIDTNSKVHVYMNKMHAQICLNKIEKKYMYTQYLRIYNYICNSPEYKLCFYDL